MTRPGVMTKFRIGELSGVDRPAQAGALALIRKRDLSAPPGPKQDHNGDTMPNALKKALGLADTASDTDVINALVAKNNESDASLRKASEDLAAANKRADRLARKAAMDDEDKEHCKAMSDDDADDFMSKPKATRKGMIEKALADDEVIDAGGQKVRKSVVGAPVFALLKSQAEQLKLNGDAIAKAAEATATATFTKAATSEYAFVNGTVDERVELLKAIDKLPEAVKKTALEGLASQNSMAKAGFNRMGTGGGGGGEGGAGAEAVITQKAKDYQKSANVSFEKAYDHIVRSEPGLYEKAEAERRARVPTN